MRNTKLSTERLFRAHTVSETAKQRSFSTKTGSGQFASGHLSDGKGDCQVRNKRLVAAADLRACGIDAMEDAAKNTKLHILECAALYRDGLLAAVFAARPFRFANITQIELGRHLRARGEGYWLSFESHETQNNLALEAPFPDDLVPYLEEYICVYRSLFHKPKHATPDANRLWLSPLGEGLCENMAYRRIMKLTRERLGRAINPRFFGHKAGTIAFTDAEHAGITKFIINQASLAGSKVL